MLTINYILEKIGRGKLVREQQLQLAVEMEEELTTAMSSPSAIDPTTDLLAYS